MEKNVKDLLVDELRDLLSTESQIIAALPKVIAGVQTPELKKAYQTHLKETKGQLARLKKIFKMLGEKAQPKFCKGTKGLIEECNDVFKDHKEKSSLRDAAFISKTQRIEHYEIAAYGTARTYAKECDLPKVADLLQETLDQEGNADKTLTKIAEGGLFKSGINILAREDVKESKHKAKARKAKAAPKKSPKTKAAPKKAAPKKATSKKAAPKKKAVKSK